jgi:hypothetical protein
VTHQLRYSDPDARPRSIVLDGARLDCTGLLRCARCPLVVVHYRDPDVRGAGSRSAHGVRLDALTTGRVPACGAAS